MGLRVSLVEDKDSFKANRYLNCGYLTSFFYSADLVQRFLPYTILVSSKVKYITFGLSNKAQILKQLRESFFHFTRKVVDKQKDRQINADRMPALSHSFVPWIDSRMFTAWHGTTLLLNVNISSLSNQHSTAHHKLVPQSVCTRGLGLGAEFIQVCTFIRILKLIELP